LTKRLSAAVGALVVALTLTAVAVAAVAPGTYKGDLYASGKKIAKAPVTIKVVGKNVTITAPRLPVLCLSPMGTYTQPGAPMKYVFKGKLNGNKVGGTYIDPLGGTGEYFKASGSFAPATKTFTGKLSFVGRCKGTATAKAKKI
jgi:hypothetical protein